MKNFQNKKTNIYSNNRVPIFRGRAFLYQDGDANIKPSIGKKNNRDDTYRKALEEANEIHQRLKIERAAAKDHGPRGLKPPPYVKLKVEFSSFFLISILVMYLLICNLLFLITHRFIGKQTRW